MKYKEIMKEDTISFDLHEEDEEGNKLDRGLTIVISPKHRVQVGRGGIVKCVIKEVYLRGYNLIG